MIRRDFWHRVLQELQGISLVFGAIIFIALVFLAPDIAKLIVIPIGIFLFVDTLRYIDEKFFH
jgi:VIT1/CCC1 family predicted Fe2+/Mn2+ transporter